MTRPGTEVGSWSLERRDGGEAPAGIETLQQLQALEGRLFDAAAKPVTVGRLQILRSLGAGGMGTVYAAHDPALDRDVAVKVLRKGLLAVAQTRERMLREAKTLARLNHPNILTIHDLGLVGDQVFITTELVEGGTLAQWCDGHREPGGRVHQVLDLAIQAARGLAAAHDAGLVHRDVKPSNLLLGADGRSGPRLRVADFGLARMQDVAADASLGRAATHDDTSTATPLTQAGSAVGTPAYMALEQFGGQADARSDQFGWAASFYEALFGVRPFAGRTRNELMDNIEAGAFVRARPAWRVPDWLRRLLERCLAAAPEDRLPSMQAVLAAITTTQRRRRRRWQAAGAAVVAVAMGLPWAWAASTPAPCAGAGDQLIGVWDDDARDRVTASLTQTDVTFAEDTARRVAGALDAYASDWLAGYTGACEATHLRGEQSAELMDQRMLCLKQRRRRLAATVEVLADANADVTQHAVEAVARLPAVEPCADPDLVSAPIEPPGPDIASETDRQRAELSRVRALASAGQYQPALALAEQVATEASALGYAPLVAEALVERGQREIAAGAYDAAEQSLREGFLAAQRVRDDATVFRAAEGLAKAIGLLLDRHDEGLWWTQIAYATAPRLGPSSAPRLADIFVAEGAILEEQGKYADGLDRLQAALAIAREHGRRLTIAKTLASIAILRYRLGDHEAAQEITREAIEARAQLLGAQHPSLAKARHNLGSMLTALRRGDEARPELERALAIREASLGPEHADVAATLVSLGLLDTVEGNHEAALAKLDRALAILERRLGPDHPRTAAALDAIARVHLGQDRRAEALPLLERALAIQQQAAPGHPENWHLRHTIGTVQMALGRPRDATRAFEAALAGLEQTLGRDHVKLAFVLTSLGDHECHHGDRSRGLELLERAHTLRRDGAAPPTLAARTDFALARCVWATAPDRSLALAKSALERTPSVGETTRVHAQIRTWLETHDAKGAAR